MLNFFVRKLKGLLNDQRFSEILTGSALSLFFRLSGTGLAMLISIFVARVYGEKTLGILSIIQSFMFMVSTLALFGTNISILSYIPEHIGKYSILSAFFVYRKVLAFVVALSLLGGTVFYFLSNVIAHSVFSKGYLSYYLGISALFVVFKALMELSIYTLRGLQLVKLFSLMQALPNVIFLILIALMYFWGENRGDPTIAQLMAWTISSILGILFIELFFKKNLKQEASDFLVRRIDLNEIVRTSAPMFMTSAMHFITAQLGVLILGIYRAPNEVAYYAVAVKLAMLTSFVLHAVNSMAASKFADYYHKEKMEDLFHIAKKSTKLIFFSTIPIIVILSIFGKNILDLFGDGFSKAYIPLLVMLFGQFFTSISGSTGTFLNMTSNQSTLRNIISISSVVYLILSFVLIPYLGILGASLTLTISVTLWNAMAMFYIKKKYGTSIGYFPFF